MATDIVSLDFDLLQAMIECCENTYSLNPQLHTIYKPSKEAMRRTSHIYRHRHPEKIKARKATRKEKGELTLKDDWTVDDLQLQIKSQKDRCWWCSKKLKGKYEIDHVIPLAKGGTNNARNIVLSCPKCNRSKGAKLPQEFMGRLF